MGRGVREVNHRRQVLTTGPPCLAQEIRFPKMVTSCCRFLCYFCRISRQNQRSMFDHLSYLLENSSIGLGENPQSRAAPQSPLLAMHQARPVSLTHSFSTHCPVMAVLETPRQPWVWPSWGSQCSGEDRPIPDSTSPE